MSLGAVLDETANARIGKERLVVLRERDYKKLLAQVGEEHKVDAGDAAESRRRMKEPGGKSLALLKKNA
jgi:hypothetical protein